MSSKGLKPGAGSVASWRPLLKDHATTRWRAVRQALGDGKAMPARDDALLLPLISALGSRAEESLGIVDRFAAGAAAEDFVNGNEAKSPNAAFLSQLNTIFEGFEKDDSQSIRKELEAAEKRGEARRPYLFQSALWQLLNKARDSAELSYSREAEMVELDRRILIMLRRIGPLVPADLSSSIGVDKAQISRSVKRLLKAGMVEREQIRSPLKLTAQAQELADRLLRVAELRNRELAFDIDDAEITDFFATLEGVLDRAIILYDNERAASRDVSGKENEYDPAYEYEDRQSGEPIAIDRSRILSPLMTLSAYLARSGALRFKRQIGLSNFEAWVLTEVAFDPPTDWPRLVKALERDHSQAGRTVNHLIERSLIIREGKPGRRHGRFSPTDEGRRLFQSIMEIGKERGEYLLSSLEEAAMVRFMATFDKLNRNAAAQLERERALEELDGKK